jgi:hypothetical protein
MVPAASGHALYATIDTMGIGRNSDAAVTADDGDARRNRGRSPGSL